MIYVLPPKWPITWMTIAWRWDTPPQKKNCSVSLHVVTNLCQFMAQNSEIWGVKKNGQLFDISKILKNWHFSAPANAQSVTYLKIQTKVCRVPWGPPMDWLLIKSVDAEYPLSCHKCVENGHFVFYAPPDPLSVLHPPKNGTTSAYLQAPRHFDAPLLLHREKNRFSEGNFFGQITLMALESPKIDICQNWPKRVLGDVIRCLESKFDKKFQWEVVQNAEKKFLITMLLGG